MKNVTRTSLGLRDALFEEIDLLRKGESNPNRAAAISKLAVQIINSAKMEVEFQKHVESNGGKGLSDSAPIKLGSGR